jgi:glycosyltransferase involved in cell wall biosynthesis
MLLIEQLAKEFDVTVYSLEKYSPLFIPKNYTAIDIPLTYQNNLTLRILWLSFLLLKNHIQKPYRVFHGLWGFPGGLIAVFFAKLFRKKSAVTFKGAEVVALQAIHYGLFIRQRDKAIVKWVTKNAHCLVAQSEYYAVKIKATVQYKTLKIIYSGIIHNHQSVRPFLPKEKYTLLHVANLNKVKNQAMLLKAFSIVSSSVNAELHIIGMDTLNGEIQLLAKEMQLEKQVFFHGVLTQQELVNYYKQADIFLLTSSSESQGVVVNEAMNYGVVVCGTRVGLIADLENKATMAVDINDAAALAEKVLHLLNNSQLYNQLQQHGYNWTKEFDIVWTREQYSQLYQELG